MLPSSFLFCFFYFNLCLFFPGHTFRAGRSREKLDHASRNYILIVSLLKISSDVKHIICNCNFNKSQLLIYDDISQHYMYPA